MPLVSILIPCYNAERWVAQAIQSALDQTHQDKEVIVVDDGSTDVSLEVIKSFGEQILWESGPNRGGNLARNRLLEMSNGEWLQFLDADDYLKPKKIDDQLRSWREAGSAAEVVYSPVCVETWAAGKASRMAVERIDSSQSIEEQWIRWQVAQTGTVLWRRSAITRIGGWNDAFTCCQDNEIMLRAIHCNLRLHLCESAEAVYRVWSEQTVCRRAPSRVIEIKTRLIDGMLDWLRERGSLSHEIQAAAGQAFFEMARTLAASDLTAATLYHRQRRHAGYFQPQGPAAPRAYRYVYNLAGFRATELVARCFRT